MQAFLQWLSEFWWLVFAFFAFFGGGIWAGTKYLIKQWQQGRCRELEIELKRDMVAKGFSPADIERVLGAAAPSTGDGQECSAAGAPKRSQRAAEESGPGFDKARLVAALTDNAFDADDIERILRVLAETTDDESPAKCAAVRSMAEAAMDAEDIERVIRAFHRQSPPAPGPVGVAELRQ